MELSETFVASSHFIIALNLLFLMRFLISCLCYGLGLELIEKVKDSGCQVHAPCFTISVLILLFTFHYFCYVERKLRIILSGILSIDWAISPTRRDPLVGHLLSIIITFKSVFHRNQVSTMNFRNIGDAFSGDGNTRKPNADPNYSLSRQPSVYALTFDEFQNTWGSLGKDFGSMNMDELLKSIWTAEESHAMASSSATAAAVAEGSIICGNLQRQGSLTLPRTLSQKTVDEVWKDLFKESIGAKDGSGGEAVTSLPQRQRTLGEMTLEEFLARAGVVREDAPKIGDVNDGAAAYEDLSNLNNNNNVAASSALASLRFQQMNQNNGLRFGVNNKFSLSQTPPSLALDVGGGVRSLQPPQPQQQFSKAAAAATMAFAAPLHLPDTTQMAGSKRKLGVLDQSINFSMVQSGGVQNGGISGVTVASLGGAGGVVVPVGSSSNPISPNLLPKSSMEQSSVSPVPYQFGRGRKPNGTLEKVVERRQRRMIKNRESAARSRARKQAYTLELEAELATLKELNRELHQKEGVHDKRQKHRFLQTVNGHWGRMRLRLRRTMTEPW